jgi:hypothetical protein
VHATGTYQRAFNRYEVKYVVPQRKADAFIQELEPYLVTDPHGRDEWGYMVQSVYWDSDDLALFWEKVEGLERRRKLRLRRYGADSEHVFVEIKQRLDRTVQKRRTQWSLDQARRAFDLGQPLSSDDGPDPGDDVGREALEMFHRYRLRPRMSVSYIRKAYFCRYEPGLRITFDRMIRFDPFRLDVSEPSDGGRYMLDPRLTVMEVKFNHRVPVWLCKAAQRRGFEMVRLSKYCTAVDRAWFGSRLT